MRRLPILHVITFLLVILSVFLFQYTPAYSTAEEDIEDEIEQTEQEIEENESKLESIEVRIDEILNSNYSITQQINLLNEEISEIEEEIDAKSEEIEKKLEEIEAKELILEEKRNLLSAISGELYMESRMGIVEFLFSNTRIDEIVQIFFVKKSAISLLRDEITEITGEFEDLALLKSGLEEEKAELDEQKEDLDDSHKLLLAERSKLQSQLNEQYNSRDLVSRTINGLKADLSDLQYHLLVVRQGGTNVNVNSVPSSGDYNATLAGFLEKAPSGYSAVFSIGAYTHRNGMSQWGARARAEEGQSYTEILNHYYSGKSLRTGTVVVDGSSEAIMTNIKTTAYGTLNFEDNYLLRLNEMPESWDMDVLRAQAIAARTYAVRYTNNGDKTICVDENCQVVGTTKKTGAWAEAVESTRGIILTNSDGSPALTQYAAVHGGWSNTSGWDTTNGSGSGDWMSRAYESIAGVSWFYKSWYRQTYSDSSSTCGRYPWLSSEELADIVNAAQVLEATGGDSRIVPIYDSCHSSGNPYSHKELRELAAKGASSVSAVVTSSSNGTTQTIAFYTNAGTVSMSGMEFKTAYNLRAPGHLRIPQNGFVHINIEKKN